LGLLVILIAGEVYGKYEDELGEILQLGAEDKMARFPESAFERKC